MLTSLIISTILLPFLIALLWDKKHIISVYVVSFISVFLIINTVNSFAINIKLITAIFSLGYISLYSFLIYKSIKLKKLNLKNLFGTIKWIAPLYMSMAIIFFIRMWFTRMNTDALFYTETANFIKNNSNNNTDPVYNLPSFYSFVAMFPRPVDVFSIGGDVIIISIFSTTIFKIIKDAREEQGLFLFLIISVSSIALALSLPFVTSSVNWVVVSLVMIVLLSLRKNVKMFLLSPIAFGIFSFSSLLLAPISLLYVLLAKKFRLKEILDIITANIVVGVIFIITLADLSEKLILFPLLISLVFLITSTPIVKVVEYDGVWLQLRKRIFKDKEMKPLYVVDKKFKITSASIMILIGLLFMILFVFIFNRSSNYKSMISKIFTDPYLWGIPLVAWIILDSLWKSKLTTWMRISLVFLSVCMVYYVLIKIFSRVPHFILLRTLDPVTSIVLVLTILFLYETYPTEKFTLKMILPLPLMVILPAIAVGHNSIPKYFYTNPSTNIVHNYRWITDKEWETLEKYKTKKVYSDVPSFIMGINGKDNNSIMNAKNHRELFHGDLFVTMYGRKEYVENNFNNIQKNIEGDGIYKWTIEYAKIYQIKTNGASWNNIDKAEIFAFRHKEYANDIMKHYKLSKNHLSVENGMYIITR